MFKLILVPHDTSSAADYALDHARAIAGKVGAKIVLLSILSSLPSRAPDRLHSVHWSHKDNVASFLESARSALEREGISAENVILEDDHVAKALVNYANSCTAVLVVMGTHGYTGFNRLWLGSVADKVRHQLHPPLLLVRQPTT